jgi:hypothetical protein
VAGLRAIMRNDLGPHMTASLDRLARNAFINAQFCTFAGGSSFGTLAANHTFDVGPLTRAINLGKEFDDDIAANPVFCITSPSAVYTIRNTASTGEWITRQQYANPQLLVNGEVGSYEGIRFVTSPLMTLFNCGAILQQVTITAAIDIGDGSPDPDTTTVDGVWRTGQAGATHYITVSDGRFFETGQTVTLHRVRNGSATQKGTLNGVTWNHKDNINRRIVAIDGNNISFDQPILSDAYGTEVTTGVYGWMTLARPVHCALFIKGPRGVVAGVIQPPMTYNPPPIDDTLSIYRFSWDAYLKYQPMFTNRFEVHYFAGPIVQNNAVTNL